MTTIDVAARKPDLLPILDGDVEDVAGYLHASMSKRVPAMDWVMAMNPPWQRGAPNHGFYLRFDNAVVGAYVALYSQRGVGGSACIRVCNLAAWCVDPAFRFNSTRLLRALLAQDGYEFTDLSPSGSVIALNERLGFRHVDTSTAIVACLPYPSARRTIDLTSDPQRISDALEGDNLRTYHDHQTSPAVKHLVLTTASGSCHVMYRRDRRRDLPLFASIIHASNPGVLSAQISLVGRHLLLHHGVPMLLCETRLLTGRPPRSFMLESPRPKMFKGATLGPDDVDNLYSELTELSW